MFKCEVTGRMSKPGDKCIKIVVERREKVYTRFFRNEETNKYEEHEVGRGWEIVKEINATEAGAKLWQEQNLPVL